MTFQRSVSQEDLRAGMSEERLEHDATTYQASRGGYFPVEETPVPAAPLEGPREA